MSLNSDSFPFERCDPPAPVRPPRERRRCARQTLIAKAALRNGALPAAARSVFVSNISMLGIGFRSRIPLEVGGKHDLNMEIGPIRWSSRMRVVSCAPTDESYEIGAEFVGNELSRQAA